MVERAWVRRQAEFLNKYIGSQECVGQLVSEAKRRKINERPVAVFSTPQSFGQNGSELRSFPLK